MSLLDLSSHRELFVNQVFEAAELFGFETRNKYRVLDSTLQPLGFAAEEDDGLFGFFMRQYFGHWRSFNIHFLENDGRVAFTASHPFRFIFQRVEIRDANGQPLGAIQKRFSVFTKRFDVENQNGLVVMEVASPLLKFWTFAFMKMQRQVAVVQKKWSGLFTEAFTDKDVFRIEFNDAQLNSQERTLVLASSIFIDLLYFERKAGN